MLVDSCRFGQGLIPIKGQTASQQKKIRLIKLIRATIMHSRYFELKTFQVQLAHHPEPRPYEPA